MSTCPDCGFKNEEGKLFCGACGEPLGGDAKLVRDMEKLNAKKAEEAKHPQEQNVPLEGRKPVVDDKFEHRALAKKKREQKTDNMLIALGLFAFFIVCVCGWLVYSSLS